MLKRLRESHRALVVGSHGSGKSTLLETLLTSLATQYSHVLRERLTRYPNESLKAWCNQRRDNLRRLVCLVRQSRRGGVVVLDGIEQISWPVKLMFCVALAARHCDLLATSHREMLGFVELYRAQLTPDLIRHLSTQLTRGSAGQYVALVQDELQRRDLSQVTNARELWFELYDLVANYNSVESLELRTRSIHCSVDARTPVPRAT